MTENESNVNTKEDKAHPHPKNKKTTIKLLSTVNLNLLEKDELVPYIIGLHKRIRLLVKRCKMYREQVSKLQKGNLTLLKRAVKTVDCTKKVDTKGEGHEETENTAVNFVDDIKNAAHQAQNSLGFIYEPTSGLYYDSRTGYYYNAELGLYYDGNTGCYYTYNQTENKFEFHSQVCGENVPDAQNDQNTIEENDVKRKEKKRKRKHYYRSPSSDLERLKYDRRSEDRLHKRGKNGRDRYEEKRHRSRSRSSTKSQKSKKNRKRSQTRSHSHSRSRDSSRSHHQKQKSKDRRNSENKDDLEDGELSNNSSSESSKSDRRDVKKSNRRILKHESRQAVIEILDSNDSSEESDYGEANKQIQDVAKRYPPSIRIIVQETNVKKLKVGELFLITYKGGSLGREGSHDVIIPDINCSKYHMKFNYDENSSEYKCVDLGSRNGTLINGKRMSNAKQESEPMSLIHGTTLQIGQTKLLCHIHDGHTTCGHCEPGLIQITTTTSTTTTSVIEPIASTIESNKIGSAAEEHKRQLKNLKKRYGLEEEQYIETRGGVQNDRAAQRRQKVGSSCEFEKTKTASLDSSIPSENKGFKMLAKLGWSEGQSLGKNNVGLLEPIPLQSNQGTSGLGTVGGVATNSSISKADKKNRKNTIWRKTQDRYQSSTPVNIFNEDSDE